MTRPTAAAGGGAGAADGQRAAGRATCWRSRRTGTSSVEARPEPVLAVVPARPRGGDPHRLRRGQPALLAGASTARRSLVPDDAAMEQLLTRLGRAVGAAAGGVHPIGGRRDRRAHGRHRQHDVIGAGSRSRCSTSPTARFPTGGYAHSFGLERYCQAGHRAATRDGRRALPPGAARGLGRAPATRPRRPRRCGRLGAAISTACRALDDDARGHEGRARVPRGQPADGTPDPAGGRRCSPATPRLGALPARTSTRDRAPGHHAVAFGMAAGALGWARGGRGDRVSVLDHRAARGRGAAAPADGPARGAARPVAACTP